MTWEKTDLISIAEVSAGGTPSRTIDVYWKNGTIPWVKISDIKGVYLDTTEENITEEGLKNSSAKLFKPGTILYTIFATLGEVAILNIDAATNQAIAGIKVVSDDVDTLFLYYFLKSIKNDILAKGRGVAQNNINLSILRSQLVPLPPIETQQKIADVLDKAQALIDKRKEQIEKLDELVQSVFIELVGTGSKDYSTWPINEIADLVVCSKNSMRTGPFGSDLLHSEFVDEGIRVLGIDNAVKNRFRLQEPRFITKEKYEKLWRYTVFPEDVIITIMGTTGRSAVVPRDITTSISTKHLAVLTLNKAKTNPYFLSFCIHSHPFVLRQINLKNSGAIMDGLNLGKIKTLKIPIPPIDLQNQFAEFVEKTEQQKALMQQSLVEMENNFNSIMQRAFKGELF